MSSTKQSEGVQSDQDKPRTAASTKPLSGKVVLIADASGELSSGITSACIEAGAQVVVPAKSEAQLEAFRQRLELDTSENLASLVTDLRRPECVNELRNAVLDRYGTLDTVIASTGRWRMGGRPLVATDQKTFQSHLDTVAVHFNLARTFVPALNNAGGGSYIFVNRHLADESEPLVGPANVVYTAERSMMESLVREHPDSHPESVRVTEIRPKSDAAACQGTCSEFETIDRKVGEMAVTVVSDSSSHGEIIPL